MAKQTNPTKVAVIPTAPVFTQGINTQVGYSVSAPNVTNNPTITNAYAIWINAYKPKSPNNPIKKLMFLFMGALRRLWIVVTNPIYYVFAGKIRY